MSQNKTDLSNMLDASLKSFQDALMESKDPTKLIRRNGKSVEKEAVGEIISQMVGGVKKLVREKMDEVIDQNKLEMKFAELNELTKESEFLNRQLDRSVGYHYIKPKLDIGMHMVSTTERLALELDEQIIQLENDVSREDAEFERLEEVFFELASIVKTQQESI